MKVFFLRINMFFDLSFSIDTPSKNIVIQIEQSQNESLFPRKCFLIFYFCFEPDLKEGGTLQIFGFQQSTTLEVWFDLISLGGFQGMLAHQSATADSKAKLFSVSCVHTNFL